jgi:hypothetical protein
MCCNTLGMSFMTCCKYCTCISVHVRYCHSTMNWCIQAEPTVAVLNPKNPASKPRDVPLNKNLTRLGCLGNLKRLPAQISDAILSVGAKSSSTSSISCQKWFLCKTSPGDDRPGVAPLTKRTPTVCGGVLDAQCAHREDPGSIPPGGLISFF